MRPDIVSPHFACVFIDIYASNDLALQMRLGIVGKLKEPIELEKQRKEIMGESLEISEPPATVP